MKVISTLLLFVSLAAFSEVEHVDSVAGDVYAENVYLGESDFKEGAPYNSADFCTNAHSDDYVADFFEPKGLVETISGLAVLIDGVEVLIDKFKRIGSEVINLLDQTRSHNCYKDKVTHVLPEGISEETMFRSLSGWERPTGKKYSLRIKSPNTGRTVVKFDYQVVATYAGSAEGFGRYLANVHVMPIGEPEVSFRWDFKAALVPLNPINVSKVAENPVAGLQLNLNYVADPKWFGSDRPGSIAFFVDGEGNIDKIGGQ